MVFRYLRTLEGVSPPLSLTHLSCQTTAKAFIATRTSLSLHSAPFITHIDPHLPAHIPRIYVSLISTPCFPQTPRPNLTQLMN